MSLDYKARLIWALLGVLYRAVMRHVTVFEMMCSLIAPIENTNRSPYPTALQTFLILLIQG